MSRRSTRIAAQNERAWNAVRNLNKMLGNLTQFARAVTRNPRIKVRATHEMTCTDGETIYIKPPARLAEQVPHNKTHCNKRDPFTRKQLCVACRLRESVMASIYHEIAHIAFGTMVAPVLNSIALVEDLVRELHPPQACNHLEAWRAQVDARTTVSLAASFAPILQLLVNALEDARVNAAMFESRPGTRILMDINVAEITEAGVDSFADEDDEEARKNLKWQDRDIETQILMLLFLFASGYYEMIDTFDPKAIAVLRDDRIETHARLVSVAPDVHEVFRCVVEIFRRLRELGYFHMESCVKQDDPETQEQDDTDDMDEDDETDPNGMPSLGADSDPDGGDAPGDSTDNEESDGEDASPGAGGGTTGDSGSSGDAEPEANDQVDDSASDEADEAVGGGDHQEEELSDEAGSSGNAGSEDVGDETDAGAGDESDDEGSGEQSDAGDVREGSADGDGEGEEAEAAGSQPRDEGDQETRQDEEEPDGLYDYEPTEQDGVIEHDGAEVPESLPGDSNAVSPYAGEDLEPAPYEELLDALRNISLHRILEPDADRKEFACGESELSGGVAGEDSLDGDALKIAILQALYFDTRSVNVGPVEIVEFPHSELGWSDRWSISMFQPPSAIIGRAVFAARSSFEDNQRARKVRHMKAGRVDARTLGRKVHTETDKLFSKRVIPGKKDYVVILGLDVSGSTDESDRISRIKRAVCAQAEVLHQLRIPFEIWAHTAGWNVNKPSTFNLDDDPFGMWMLKVKDADEQWGRDPKMRLANLRPLLGNLDGHTLEFYRKRAEYHMSHRPGSRGVVCYYTDGAMPAANYEEELDVLKENIRICRQRSIPLLAVGIDTNSPAEHGFDTVEVRNDNDLVKVVQQLGRLLTS